MSSKYLPNYKKIYNDILKKKYPHKIEECKSILEKENLAAFDIIELNKKIFTNLDKNKEKENKKFRAYTTTDIAKILDYQNQYKLSNIQVANHFKISRTTIAKWKKNLTINGYHKF